MSVEIFYTIQNSNQWLIGSRLFFCFQLGENTMVCNFLFVHVRGTTQRNALCTLTIEALNSGKLKQATVQSFYLTIEL